MVISMAIGHPALAQAPHAAPLIGGTSGVSTSRGPEPTTGLIGAGRVELPLIRPMPLEVGATFFSDPGRYTCLLPEAGLQLRSGVNGLAGFVSGGGAVGIGSCGPVRHGFSLHAAAGVRTRISDRLRGQLELRVRALERSGAKAFDISLGLFRPLKRQE
jgi:hypothetical protein